MFNEKNIRHNKGIRAPSIRLIDADGQQVGVVSVQEGMRLAEQAGLDLVEVSGTVTPPVCRIMDFGKYCYSLEKKEKENRKKHREISVKEVKLSLKIEEHDYQTKLRQCIRFLERGDKVKVTMQFRGREAAHVDIGKKILKRLFADIADIGGVERDFGMRGSLIIVVLAPKSQLHHGSAHVNEILGTAAAEPAPGFNTPRVIPTEPTQEPPSQV